MAPTWPETSKDGAVTPASATVNVSKQVKQQQHKQNQAVTTLWDTFANTNSLSRERAQEIMRAAETPHNAANGAASPPSPRYAQFAGNENGEAEMWSNLMEELDEQAANPACFPSSPHPTSIHEAEESGKCAHVPPPVNEQRIRSVTQYLECYHLDALDEAMETASLHKDVNQLARSVYDVLIEVDPILLLAWGDGSIGVDVMSGFINDVHEDFAVACFRLLEHKLAGPRLDSLLPEQLRLYLRLAYLPPFWSLLGSFHDAWALTRDYRRSGLCQVTGIICGAFLPEYRIYSQAFACINAKCNNKNTMHVTFHEGRLRCLKRAEDGVQLQLSCHQSLHAVDMKCNHCGVLMVEQMTERVYTVCKRVLVCPNPTDWRMSQHAFSSCIPVLLEDDLANFGVLGAPIAVLGTFRREWEFDCSKKPWLATSPCVLTCNNVVHPMGDEDSLNAGPIRYIYESRNDETYTSTWMVTAGLLEAFGPTLHFAGNAILKLMLMLSIVSVTSDMAHGTQSDDVNAPVHIAILRLHSGHTQRTIPLPVERVLMWAGQVAPRYQRCKPVMDAKSLVVQPSVKQLPDCVLGGPFVLARGGVCLVDLHGSLKKGDVRALQEAMSTGYKPLISNRLDSIQFDNNVGIWAYTSLSRPAKVQGDLSTVEGYCDENMCGLLDRFDLFFVLDEQACEELEENQVESILQDATATPCSAGIPEHEWNSYLKCAQRIRTTISEDCMSMLRTYFLRRRNNVERSTHFQLPEVGSIDLLARLTVCHAKLQLRETTIAEDAVVAIAVVEESLAAHSGKESLFPCNFLPKHDGVPGDCDLGLHFDGYAGKVLEFLAELQDDGDER